jgi:hypothetical protein
MLPAAQNSVVEISKMSSPSALVDIGEPHVYHAAEADSNTLATIDEMRTQ